jgi:hypothetical protein
MPLPQTIRPTMDEFERRQREAHSDRHKGEHDLETRNWLDEARGALNTGLPYERLHPRERRRAMDIYAELVCRRLELHSQTAPRDCLLCLRLETATRQMTTWISGDAR